MLSLRFNDTFVADGDPVRAYVALLIPFPVPRSLFPAIP